jgi:hypothetical protein
MTDTTNPEPLVAREAELTRLERTLEHLQYAHAALGRVTGPSTMAVASPRLQIAAELERVQSTIRRVKAGLQ